MSASAGEFQAQTAVGTNPQLGEETSSSSSRKTKVMDVSASQTVGPEAASRNPAVVKSRPQTWLAVPVGACIALAIHFLVPKREPVATTNYYPLLLSVML